MRCVFARSVVRSSRRDDQFKILLSNMSPELQGLVTTHCYSQYVNSIPFFSLTLADYDGFMRIKAAEEVKFFTMQVLLYSRHTVFCVT